MPQIYQDLLYRFAFPFNVYNFILVREEGHVGWLHYGLFEHPDDSLGQAQQRATDKILEQLPAAPAHVLDVGFGLGTLGSLLVGKGYSYTGISPDRNQVSYAKAFHPELEDRLIPAKFEYIQSSTPFDAIIFHGSAQFIEPRVMLNNGIKLLRPGGRLIAMDDSPAALVETLHPGGELLPGLRLQTLEDLTAQAQPTLEHLQTLIQSHREAILQNLDVSAAQLDTLRQALAGRLEDYQQGRYRFMLAVAHLEAVPPRTH